MQKTRQLQQRLYFYLPIPTCHGRYRNQPSSRVLGVGTQALEMVNFSRLFKFQLLGSKNALTLYLKL